MRGEGRLCLLEVEPCAVLLDWVGRMDGAAAEDESALWLELHANSRQEGGRCCCTRHMSQRHVGEHVRGTCSARGREGGKGVKEISLGGGGGSPPPVGSVGRCICVKSLIIMTSI